MGKNNQDSIVSFNQFISEFLTKADKFLNWREKREKIDNRSLDYIDSLYYYGLSDEAGRQLYYIQYRNSNLHNKLAVLNKSRKLYIDWVFFKVLDEFKNDLKRRGYSYSHDTWLRLNYPILFKDIISYNIDNNDPYLALAVIRRESRFDPHAVSRVGALGLMQLMPATAAQMAGVKKVSQSMLFDPGYNVKLGCKYLNWLERRLHKNEIVIAAYNAGPSAAKRWRRQAGTDTETYIETIGYDQSRNYTRWVIGDYLWYKHIWPNEFGRQDVSE